MWLIGQRAVGRSYEASDGLMGVAAMADVAAQCLMTDQL
jgi:hypothetical protein